ncbi:MAG: DUF1744 domain-containing protein [Candidatus Thermoplasmatota archaeon]|jgi:DNA polymerase I|nr:DUF1744 domain-containing protein [Candidatus Thermoplasmatota archaeon]
MQVRMRIITASYRTEDTRVELFGRCDDGRSATVLCGGFDPYIDVIEPSEAEIAGIKKNSEFKRIQEIMLWYDGKERKSSRIYLKHPFKVPEIRELFVSKVMSADIPFHHRFIYDLDIGSCVQVEGGLFDDKRYSTDIVIETTTDGIKNCEDFNPDIRILSFDIENVFPPEGREQFGRILIIGYSISTGKSPEHEKGALTGDEKDILRKFNELIKEKDPDILIGYNIDGYDLPVIEYRMQLHDLKLKIGRDGSNGRRINGQFWRVNGRIISDVWWNVKKYLKPKQETLNYVANELLGEGKDDVDRLRILEEYKNRPDDVIKYCIKDADLTLGILMKMRVVDHNMFMATVTKLPLVDTTNGGTSNYVDSLLIRMAFRRDIAVPMTASSNLKNKPIEGGHVESIGAGLYNMVAVMDFKSMYPSMIMKYNICFTTLSPEGEIVSPTGIRFLSPTVRKGLIPELLKSLMDSRDRVKNDMKTATGEEREYLDGVQGAIKILMNTFYGVLASAFYRFTNSELGASVTAFARETILKLINDLKNEGFRVIYGDTDSVFIETGKSDLKEAVELGKKLASDISKKMDVSIEFEKIMDPFFSHGAKKRYVGMMVYPEQDAGKMLVRGYEVRRTDSFGMQSEALETVFEHIMKRDIDGAEAYSRNIVQKILDGSPDIDIAKLAISRSVKDEASYSNADSMANVRAARKLQEMGERFIPGMKVAWIVTDSSVAPQEVEPFINAENFKYTPDWAYYGKRVEETVNRIMEGLGRKVDVAETLSSQRKHQRVYRDKNNTTLDSFF